MGVTGLWKLIEPSGKPVPLETLENKVLAIDISIWLHQVVKGFQDNKGNTLAHAHLLGLFHRLCKLLYYRIKPVFVFDGGIPQLKRETINKRNQSKNKLLNEADRLQTLLLQTLAKERVVQQALGPQVTDILKKSPNKSKPSVLQKPEKDDIFKLPDLPANKETPCELNASTSTCTSATDSDSSLDDTNLREAYAHNLQAVNVMSNEFKNLPADIRYEILTDIKETRKQSSWGRLHELPAHSDQFSSFQMKRLLKRRQVQLSLEEAEKQMEGRSLTLSELQSFLTEEGVITAKRVADSCSRQIASDENTRYLLVRDLKKAIEAAARKEIEEKQQQQSSQSTQSSNSSLQEILSQELQNIVPKIKKNINDTEKKKNYNEDLGDEYDEDLQKAIKMSLECNDPVYDDKDYECDEIRMNREQRKLLKDAAQSLAKAYLIEYGGMNDDEVKEMLEQTQNHELNIDEEDEDAFSSLNFRFNDKFILNGEMCSPYRKMKIPMGKEVENENKNEEKNNEIEFISDSDDSDLVEVVEKEDPSPVKMNMLKSEAEKIDNDDNGKIEIKIDLTKKLDENDDIFADIFEDKYIKEDSIKENGKLKIFIEENGSEINQLENEQIVLEKLKKIEKENSKEMIENVKESGNFQIKSLLEAEKPEDILLKLKMDLENVKKITLDENIEIKNENINNFVINEQNSNEAESILDSLKKELLEIPKINLDDIKVDDNDVSEKDRKKLLPSSPLPNEIIEIPDDYSPQKIKTPSKERTKQETISNYFETQYKVKRTPEKTKQQNENDDLQSTPKVKTPFFVRKTPGSSGGRKRKTVLEDDNDDDDDETIKTPSKRNKKISKALFESPKDQTDDGFKPIEEDPLEIAAKTLKDNKTKQELEVIATDIAKEKHELEIERNKQDRMGTSITDKMSYECMQLLRLFGIPYIVAPMEAEAQCAFLDAANLTDGTITDDSDIWLFGGKTVYKNFFNQQKHVMEFRIDNIEKLFNVDRKKLIQLAILVGSDYTSGINGIGTVTALEILATFPITPEKDNETTEIMSISSSLRKFREWWHSGKKIGPYGRTVLRNKLKNIEIIGGFPNLQIIEAYLKPKIDTSREKFSWGNPDVETIYEFTKKNFGWTKIKTDSILQPVLKKMHEKKIQLSIKNYFTVKSALSVRELKVSKRVQKAIDKLSLDPEKYNEISEDAEKKKTKKSRNQKPSTAVVASTSKQGYDDQQQQEKKVASIKRRKRTKKDEKDETEIIESNSSNTVPSKPKLSRLLVATGSHETIPQREKDSEEMRKRKAKAAEVLRKSKEIQKGKRNVSK